MKTCGIIAEYNPFHKGHLYHIEKTRELLGEDTAIICCMSGDYVQRGEAAVMNKSLRAEAAVRCGADLVLSLPLRWSLSSAQGFADGAVRVLAAAGADYLSFGAENDDTCALSELAKLISEKSVIDATLEHMREGLSYARARERELYRRIKERSALISSPNNILAVEYIRAIGEQGAAMVPLAVRREGAGHDGGPVGGMASASYIRELLRSGGSEKARAFMPEASCEILERAMGAGLVLDDLTRLDCAMTAVLSRISACELGLDPDAAEGIENRLRAAVLEGRTFVEICDLAKTKRYAHSRIRRMLFRAFLGVKGSDMKLPAFSRVLAFNDRGRSVLSALPEREDFTFITKPASAKRLSPALLADFELEAAAARAYDMALPAFHRLDGKREWTEGGVYINKSVKKPRFLLDKPPCA